MVQQEKVEKSKKKRSHFPGGIISLQTHPLNNYKNSLKHSDLCNQREKAEKKEHKDPGKKHCRA